MTESRTCSRCGAELSADAPGGHCLPCLLQLGLASEATSAEEVAAGILPPGSSLAEKPGDHIGHYKLLQQIGEGGCGVVYMAEQEEPVRRRVALKIIKLGMDTRQVIARFEAERQALAMMDHPNIAKIYDAGATDAPFPDSGSSGHESAHSPPQESQSRLTSAATGPNEIPAGRPYFVMELVRGVKITTYCDQQKLSTRQRLDLFIQVCQAIQHAHQKGIIHRDLKPSNILVTEQDGAPVPKIIDFGIAKATTDQRLTDKTLFTAFEQFIGTPAYMSPEQAGLDGLDIDTRSDIYSLGVLLYELLTGRPPFDAKDLLKAGLDEMRRTIREKEPLRPSTKLSQTLVAANVSSLKSPPAGKPATEEEVRADSRRLLRIKETISLLRGDLDWIVMKALEKDRRRRYETANGLARDLRRYLDNEPVVARPPSKLYRFQKTVRRNRLAFTAAGAVLAALVVGLAIALWQFIEKSHAYTQARIEAAKSRQAAQFLKDVLQDLGPSVTLGRDPTMVRELLDRAANRIDRDFTNQPETAIELRTTLATTYGELGLIDKMEELVRKNLALAQSTFGEESLAAAEALSQLGEVQSVRTKLVDAEDLIRNALRIRRKLLGEEHLDVARSLHRLGIVLHQRGMPFEAEAVYEQALAIARKLVGDEHAFVAEILSSLAIELRGNRTLDEAETASRQALKIKQKLLGEHPSVAEVLDVLALVLKEQGKLAEAEDAYRQALALNEKLLGKDHHRVGRVLSGLGATLVEEGKLVEAESLLRNAFATQTNALGQDNVEVTWTLRFLGSALERQGKWADAEDIYRKAIMIRGKLPVNVNGFVHLRLASVLRKQGKLSDVEIAVREGIAAYRKLADAGKAVGQNGFAWVLATYPDPLIRDGRSAVTYAEKAVAATKRRNPEYLNTLAAAYAEVGDFAKAAAVQREAMALLTTESQKQDPASRLRLYEANTPYHERAGIEGWR